MNFSLPKRFMIVTAVFYIGAFLFFILLNNIQFAPKEIDLYFKNSWIINRSLLQLFENLVKIQCSAVVFTFSVFYPKIKSDSGLQLLTSKNFNQLVTVIVIILIALTALFFVGNEIFKHSLYEKTDNYRYLTEVSREYLDQAKQSADEGRLLEAEEDIQRYLAIKPDDPEGSEFYQTLLKRIDNQYSTANTESAGTSAAAKQNMQDLSYTDALRLAESYLKKEDYYSAYYYAQIASNLSSGSEDAKDIRAEAWTALSKTAPSSDETEEFTLFARKKRGTELLLGKNPIDAYYLFNQLDVEYPDDPDVNKYLNESIKETRKLTYFIDEAVEALSFPGINDICFLNTNDDSVRELYFFGKMVNLIEGVFFENIEVITFSSDRGVTKHLSAKYGKLIGEHIVLNGIDKENRSIRIYPEYLITDKIPELYNTIKLNADWTKLHGFSSDRDIYKKLSIIELLDLEPVIAGYGWMVEPLYIEIINRILAPCNFIILSLITIAIAWQYRRFEGKIPIAGFILSPVVIYIFALFSDTYTYGIRLLTTWIFLGFGKPAAISLLAVSQVILLITAFLLIAGLRTADEDKQAG